jgi:hypothetical protein
MQRTPRGHATKIRSMLAEPHVVSSSRAPAFIPGWVLGTAMVLVPAALSSGVGCNSVPLQWRWRKPSGKNSPNYFGRADTAAVLVAAVLALAVLVPAIRVVGSLAAFPGVAVPEPVLCVVVPRAVALSVAAAPAVAESFVRMRNKGHQPLAEG